MSGEGAKSVVGGVGKCRKERQRRCEEVCWEVRGGVEAVGKYW